jgi:uncharacterized protein (TIGR02453 family)
VATFCGFPPEAIGFFHELERNNNRVWWQENKHRFDAEVRDPMRALLDELTPTFGTFHAFRMNRDVRFSRDKSPYKTAHAAMTETEGASALYLQISGTGLFVGGGMYHPAKDQLARMREAIAEERSGSALVKAISRVRRARLDVTAGHEPPLKTAPRGFDKDHPRIELLRWKGCIASKDLGTPAWLHTRRAAREVAAVWERSAPLIDWLDTHVGPSELEVPA